MAKIKAQLDTFKSEDRYATLQKAFATSNSPPIKTGSTSNQQPKSEMQTPTIPNAGDITLHPNTPNYGFEFSTPPNLKTSASANYFSILTSVTSSSDPRSSTSSHGDTDSASPLVRSNSKIR